MVDELSCFLFRVYLIIADYFWCQQVKLYNMVTNFYGIFAYLKHFFGV